MRKGLFGVFALTLAMLLNVGHHQAPARHHPRPPVTTTTVARPVPVPPVPSTTLPVTPTTIRSTTTTVARPTTTTTVPRSTTTTVPVTTTTAPSGNYPSGLAPPATPAGMKQALFDNFLAAPAPPNWYAAYYVGHPGGTNGWWLPSHVSVSGGLLNLTMYQDKASGDSADNYWTGGGIQSPVQFPVGSSVYVDMRIDSHVDVSGIALLIGGKGQWPPEIDFVETSPTSSTVSGFTASAHYGAGNSQVQVSSPKIDMSTWHVWGVQYGAKTISYTLDGKVWASIPNPSTSTSDTHSLAQPQVLSLQIQTGDSSANGGTPPADSSVTVLTPLRMQVDWVDGLVPA